MVGFLTQLYQNKIIPLSSVLSLITNREKPLAFFGRKIDWMKPDLISRVVKQYLTTGVFDNSLLPVSERINAELNSIIYKNVLIHRIDKLIKRIDRMDVFYNRNELLKTINLIPKNLSREE
jgi:hypothetical protein